MSLLMRSNTISLAQMFCRGMSSSALNRYYPPPPKGNSINIKDTDIELMDPEIKKHNIELSQTDLTTDQPMNITDFNGVPKEHIYERRVRISQPTKNAMQSGNYGHNKWMIEFENRERWENPLMGWTSTGDPLSNMNVWFSTKEEAAEFCQKNGWYYEISEPQERKKLNKTYSENFSWNKRTRVGSK